MKKPDPPSRVSAAYPAFAAIACFALSLWVWATQPGFTLLNAPAWAHKVWATGFLATTWFVVTSPRPVILPLAIFMLPFAHSMIQPLLGPIPRDDAFSRGMAAFDTPIAYVVLVLVPALVVVVSAIRWIALVDEETLGEDSEQ